MMKADIASHLHAELAHRRSHGVIATGAMSDPYNPFEQDQQAMRILIAACIQFGYGLQITTKSDLVLRDLDLLEQLAQHQPVCVAITVTTFDSSLSSRLEPRASSVAARISALTQLRAHGIYCGLLMMPIIPFLNDTAENVEALAHAACAASLNFVYPFFGVTLRDRQRTYFYEHLRVTHPQVVQKIQQTYGNQYSCISPAARDLQKRLDAICLPRGIVTRMAQINRGYREPFMTVQASLFG